MGLFRKKISTELLGCPFCGKRPLLHEAFGKLVARCMTADCIGPDTYLRLNTTDLREVAAMWNRRPKRAAQESPYEQSTPTPEPTPDA